MPTKAHSMRGFIISLELILIITILIIGLVVGIIAIRDALILRWAKEQSNTVIVMDDQGTRIGKAIGFDEHEAPLLLFSDTTAVIAGATISKRVLLGVRDDRFTSREPIYYDGPNCTGNPCIKSLSNEVADSSSVSGVAFEGSVSYFNALQTEINYAVGSSAIDDVKGMLFRSSLQACPATYTDIQSVYRSQKVVNGRPCDEFSPNLYDADTSCLVGVTESTSILGLQQSVQLSVACNECPIGYEPQGDIVGIYLESVELLVNSVLTTTSLLGITGNVSVSIGELCCPEETLLNNQNLVNDLAYTILDITFDTLGLDTTSTLLSGLLSDLGIVEGSLTCVPNVTLSLAEQVPVGLDDIRNKLEPLVPPFSIVAPAGGVSDVWMHTPPVGEGNFVPNRHQQ